MEYTPSDYRFPRVYVESSRHEECLHILDGRAVVEKPCRGGGLGLAVYESILEDVLDPVEAVIKKRFAVYNPRKGRAILLEPGDRVYLVEALGVQVNHVAEELDEVSEQSILAYILTGKGETRTLRAGVEGVVAYIGWGLEGDRQRYIYVIAPRDSARILEVEEGGH